MGVPAVGIVSVKFDLKSVEAGLHALGKTGHQMVPVFRKLEKPLKHSIKQIIARQIGPGKRKWEPLADSTLGKKKTRRRFGAAARRAVKERGLFKSFTKRGKLRKRHKPVLGDMAKRNYYRSRSYALIVGNKIPYAKYQFHGAQGTGKGRKGSIPARQWLWFTDQFLKTAAKRIVKEMVKAWQWGARK